MLRVERRSSASSIELRFRALPRCSRPCRKLNYGLGNDNGMQLGPVGAAEIGSVKMVSAQGLEPRT